MAKYDIAIIVAAYNVENYISQCIESLLGQEKCSPQIIIVDDGSTDSTGDKIKTYASANDHIVYVYQENSGLGAARNTGLRYVDSDYIGFLDGDDYVDSLMFYFMLSKAKEHDVDVVSCLHNCFIDGKDGGEYVYPVYPFSESEVFFDRNDSNKHLALLNYSVCNKIFKKNISLCFPEGILHEDIPVVYGVYLKKCSILVLDKAMHFYRQVREGQITRKNDSSRYDIFKICNLVGQVMLESGANKSWYGYFYGWKLNYINAIYKRLRPDLRGKYLDLAAESFSADLHPTCHVLLMVEGRRLRFLLLKYNLQSLYRLLCCFDVLLPRVRRRLSGLCDAFKG